MLQISNSVDGCFTVLVYTTYILHYACTYNFFTKVGRKFTDKCAEGRLRLSEIRPPFLSYDTSPQPFETYGYLRLGQLFFSVWRCCGQYLCNRLVSKDSRKRHVQPVWTAQWKLNKQRKILVPYLCWQSALMYSHIRLHVFTSDRSYKDFVIFIQS